MHDHIPSKTALRVAMRRAVHQLLDNPKILDDPFALAILGEDTAAELRAAPEQFERLGTTNLRALVAARSRFAEDQVTIAVGQGVRQCVVLGAGLDTFAYRNRFEELQVIEVDHPATQAWKLEMLASAGIAIPPWVSFVAVDFVKQDLANELARSRFRVTEPAFFSWLGVVPYLTRDAALGTLRWIGSLPKKTSVVFDYAIARSALSPQERAALDALSQRVARAGEPFQLFFGPDELAAALHELGFNELQDLGAAEINARYFVNRTDGLKIRGNLGHLMSARVGGPSGDLQHRSP